MIILEEVYCKRVVLEFQLILNYILIYLDFSKKRKDVIFQFIYHCYVKDIRVHESH